MTANQPICLQDFKCIICKQAVFSPHALAAKCCVFNCILYSLDCHNPFCMIGSFCQPPPRSRTIPSSHSFSYTFPSASTSDRSVFRPFRRRVEILIIFPELTLHSSRATQGAAATPPQTHPASVSPDRSPLFPRVTNSTTPGRADSEYQPQNRDSSCRRRSAASPDR